MSRLDEVAGNPAHLPQGDSAPFTRIQSQYRIVLPIRRRCRHGSHHDFGKFGRPNGGQERFSGDLCGVKALEQLPRVVADRMALASTTTTVLLHVPVRAHRCPR